VSLICVDTQEAVDLAREQGLLHDEAAPDVAAMPEQRRPQTPTARFLTVAQVAEELATNTAQIMALVRRGHLPAVELDGHDQWRIERSKLEEFIARAYDHTARAAHTSAESAVMSPA
jgi:prophage regulatory protein